MSQICLNTHIIYIVCYFQKILKFYDHFFSFMLVMRTGPRNTGPVHVLALDRQKIGPPAKNRYSLTGSRSKTGPSLLRNALRNTELQHHNRHVTMATYTSERLAWVVSRVPAVNQCTSAAVLTTGTDILSIRSSIV